MLVARRPSITPDHAARLARELYGVDGTAEPLPGERDCNHAVTTPSGERFVLKLAHPDEREDVLDLQNEALRRLDEPIFPRLVGRMTRTTLGGTSHLVRLLTHLDGEPVRQASPGLLERIGASLGRMDSALSGLSHPAASRYIQWDARHAAETIRERLELIDTDDRRRLVSAFLESFRSRVGELPRSVIHNDANDNNLLVCGDELSGIIDFGDMVETWTVCEPAIACAYLMMGRSEPLDAASRIVRGYRAEHPLSTAETRALLHIAAIRLCLSVCISARQKLDAPDDPYLTVSEEPAWALLERLAEIDLDEAGSGL